MSFRYLSHILFDGAPAYGGSASLHMHAIRSLLGGDHCNVCRFSIESHWGTHVDLPNHFFQHGKKVDEYPPESWFFHRPQIIDVSLEPSQLLRCGSWINEIAPNSDILLIRSGWSSWRSEKKYVLENPGIHPEVGAYLRSRNRSVRALGLDWISVSSYQDRSLGRDAHRVFLDPDAEGSPIMLIEDADLSGDLKNLDEVYVAPLRIRNADSAPCTVIGKCDD